MEFLREVAPNARVIALLMNPDNLNYEVDVDASQKAARDLGRQTIIVDARSPGEIEGAFDTIKRKHVGAVLVASDLMMAWTREFVNSCPSCNRPNLSS